MIRTGRLVLRRARPDDLLALHEILSDPRAMAWWSTTPHETVEATQTWLDAMICASLEGNEDYIVEHEGRVIGKAGFWKLPEIGYILHPAAWGQGFAREACSAVIAHVWSTRPDLDRLIADVDPHNAASIKLLERLGFRRTGAAERTFLVGGVWMDSLYYSLERPDYSA